MDTPSENEIEPSTPASAVSPVSSPAAGTTAYAVLLALALSHAFNDTFQSLISAIYPVIKESLVLSLAQIGTITLVFQFTSSVFQPVIGLFTDKKPQPYSLPFGMGMTLLGLLMFSNADNFWVVLLSVALIGLGSSVFHPEASRLAFMASGGRFGLAQSVFQVGGNFGSALGPFLAWLFVAQRGQSSIVLLTPIALLAMMVMFGIGEWYKRNLSQMMRREKKRREHHAASPLPQRTVVISLIVLLILIFSKYVYLASISNYYTFYLMDKFQVSKQDAPLYLFIYLISAAGGTLIGGPVGDKMGRKWVIWFSVLGAAPFTLALPYVDSLFWTAVLSGVIGFVLASAFSAILIFAQELVPGKVGMVAGLFFGFAFGVAGIASAFLGYVADWYGIAMVYHLCSYLPLLGLTTVLLPHLKQKSEHK